MKLVNISPHSLPYYRMVGYIVTILMHSINVSVMLYGFRGDVFKDPNIQVFYYFMDKFITCWTFFFQTLHAIVGLSCDILTIMNEGKKEPSSLALMKHFRNVLFASIVVPYTFIVPTVFWPLFLYNRELILPAYTTKIVGSLSNHVMHSAIVPATIWEMMFQPRELPRSHRENLVVTGGYAFSYLIVIFVSYFKIGMFPYPLLTMLYGSVYFVVFVGFVITWIPIIYYGQWHINDLLWRRRVKKEC